MKKFFLVILTLVLAITQVANASEPQVSQETENIMELHQIKVGCADAYLIRDNKATIIIDGGLGTTASQVVQYLHNVGVTKIDAYIASHYDLDHVGAMFPILRAFATAETIVYGPSHIMIERYSPLPAGQYRQMKDGDVVQYGDMTLHCLGPHTVQYEGEFNSDSLNILFTFGERKFFMTGDWLDQEVCNKYASLLNNIDVLKWPHHGLSPFAVKERTLQVCNPIGFLVPANNSNAAQQKAFELGLYGAFYDNESGNIVVTTNGKNLKFHENVNPFDWAR